jgi:hypothetical protein
MRLRENPDVIEGPEATQRFDALVRKVLAVPHAEIMRREAEYKKQSAMNPHKRGPKPKIKPSASGRVEAEP